MTMHGNYRRVQYSDFDALLIQSCADSNAMSKVLYPDKRFVYDPPGMRISIGGTWDGLRFVLNEGKGNHGGVFRNILGATPIGEYASYLDPQEVKELKDALDKLTPDQLKSLYDPEALNRANVFPSGRWDSTDFVYLWSAVEKLRPFLAEALFFGEIVICWVG